MRGTRRLTQSRRTCRRPPLKIVHNPADVAERKTPSARRRLGQNYSIDALAPPHHQCPTELNLIPRPAGGARRRNRDKGNKSLTLCHLPQRRPHHHLNHTAAATGQQHQLRSETEPVAATCIKMGKGRSSSYRRTIEAYNRPSADERHKEEQKHLHKATPRKTLPTTSSSPPVLESPREKHNSERQQNRRKPSPHRGRGPARQGPSAPREPQQRIAPPQPEPPLCVVLVGTGSLLARATAGKRSAATLPNLRREQER